MATTSFCQHVATTSFCHRVVTTNFCQHVATTTLSQYVATTSLINLWPTTASVIMWPSSASVNKWPFSSSGSSWLLSSAALSYEIGGAFLFEYCFLSTLRNFRPISNADLIMKKYPWKYVQTKQMFHKIPSNYFKNVLIGVQGYWNNKDKTTISAYTTAQNENLLTEVCT